MFLNDTNELRSSDITVYLIFFVQCLENDQDKLFSLILKVKYIPER